MPAARALRRLCVLALTLALPAAVAGQPEPPAATGAAVPEGERGFDPGQSAGLFVGIREFEDGQLAAIPYAVDDAVDLAHLFSLELRLIAPGKVALALAGEPQKEASRQRLEALRAAGASEIGTGKNDLYRQLLRQGGATGADGLFVVALATHGFSEGGTHYLAGADALSDELMRAESSIALPRVLDAVKRARAPRQIVLLDACQERLQAGRAMGLDPRSALSDGFRRAVAEATGQVVLSGAPLGGWSYDDPERGNGVFTGALIDGLRGGADSDERNLITVRTLADFVDHRVAQWVREHRGGDADLSTGIEKKLDGSATDLPLAADAGARQRAALDAVKRAFVDTPRRRRVLTAEMVDEIEELLGADPPPADLDELLELAEALDGGGKGAQTALKYFLGGRSRSEPREPSATAPPAIGETAPPAEVPVLTATPFGTADPWMQRYLAKLPRERLEDLGRSGPYIGIAEDRPLVVLPGSPAARAGLRTGDEIVGRPVLVAPSGEPRTDAREPEAGDTARITVERAGRRITADVPLEINPFLGKRDPLFGRMFLAAVIEGTLDERLEAPEPEGACSGELWIGLRKLYCRLRMPGGGFLATLGKIAGQQVFLSGPHGEDPVFASGGRSFGHYNPQFVRWATDQIPDGDNQHPAVAGIVARMYDAWLRDLARTFYVAYRHVRANPGPTNDLVDWYRFATENEGWLDRWAENSVRRLMQERGWSREQAVREINAGGSPFKARLDEQARPFANSLLRAEHDWYDAYSAYGFWIRRLVDGTADEFHTGLVKLLRTYDAEWLSVQR